jgi:hypothetical protein
MLITGDSEGWTRETGVKEPFKSFPENEKKKWQEQKVVSE